MLTLSLIEVDEKTIFFFKIKINSLSLKIVDNMQNDDKHLRNGYECSLPNEDTNKATATTESNNENGLPIILTRPFFIIKDILKSTDIHRKSDGVIAVCVTCSTKIKGSKQITSNFIQHLKHQHSEKYQDYKQKKNYQKSNRNFNKQTKFENQLLKFVVSSSSPMSIVENEDFIKLFEDTPKKVKSRKHMQNLLEKQCQIMELNIKSYIQKVSFLCCTADIWSGRHKSFFGYTAHWIEDNLERNSAVLACKRFISPHNYTQIAAIITKINEKFGIQKNQIVCTITDNGSNFVKAFEQHGVKEFDNDYDSDDQLEPVQLLPSSNNNNRNNDENDSNRNNADSTFQLSKHYRCGSHTLNLLSTTDFIKAIKQDNLVFERHKSAIAKCEKLWSKTKRPKAYEKIYEIIKGTLKTPTITRWNSLFDSIQHLLKFKNKFGELTNAFDIDDFLLEDVEYLEEYVKLMQPISEALDFFQSENNIYYGYFLPALLTLKLKIRKVASQLLLLGNVARTLITKLEYRFSSIFVLERKSYEVVIAAMTCPQVRFLKCSQLLDIWQETSPFINEIYLENIFINYLSKENIGHTAPRVTTVSNLAEAHSFFRFEESDNEALEEGEVLNHDRIRKDLRDFTIENGTPLNDLNKYSLIKNIFFKTNTPLPSSAPVERLFSLAGIINQPRRQRLTDTNFEEFLLSKANAKYLKNI